MATAFQSCLSAHPPHRQMFFMKALEPSSWAAAAVGPKAVMPAADRLSTWLHGGPPDGSHAVRCRPYRQATVLWLGPAASVLASKQTPRCQAPRTVALAGMQAPHAHALSCSACPAQRSALTRPSTSGCSGPTITKSMPFSRQKEMTCAGRGPKQATCGLGAKRACHLLYRSTHGS